MIKVVYKFQCDHCNRITEHHSNVSLSNNVINVDVPYGWKMIGNMLICDNHDVEIKYVDKKMPVSIPLQ